VCCVKDDEAVDRSTEPAEGSPERGKVMGLDLGSKRIGVAVSDSRRTLALPVCVVQRSGDRERDMRKLAEVVNETGACRVVVGLPLSLDGSEGPAAREAHVEAQALASELEPLSVVVETFDERLSTVSAEAELARAGKRGRDRRAVVDSAAAMVILQSWLDSARTRGQ